MPCFIHEKQLPRRQNRLPPGPFEASSASRLSSDNDGLAGLAGSHQTVRNLDLSVEHTRDLVIDPSGSTA